MIIIVKNADYSTSNIGTTGSMVRVVKNIQSGVIYNIPNYVNMGDGVNWTLSTIDSYEFDSYTITMGGTTITPKVQGSVMTIAIGEITGEVVISITTNYIDNTDYMDSANVFRAGSVNAYMHKGIYFDFDTGMGTTDSGNGGTLAVDVKPYTDYQVVTSTYFPRNRTARGKVQDISITPESVYDTEEHFVGCMNINSRDAETLFFYLDNGDGTSSPVNGDTFKVYKDSHEIEFRVLYQWAISTSSDETSAGKENAWRGQHCVIFNVEPNTSYTVTDHGTHNRFRFYGIYASLNLHDLGSTSITGCYRMDKNAVSDTDTTHTINSGSFRTLLVYLNGGDLTLNSNIEIKKA